MAGNKIQKTTKLWIVKIGGSIISTEYSKSDFNEQTIRLIASHLKLLPEPLIIVHGTGYISKTFAQENHFLNGKIEAHRKETVTHCLLMLREIHFAVLRFLVQGGIKAVSISPLTFCELRNGRIRIIDPSILQIILKQGFVPLIHGDLIIDKLGNFMICSSDAIITELIMHFPAEKLLFATDVPGVYLKDPKKFPNSKLFNRLSYKTLNMLAMLPDDHNDVSGAMPAKLKAIQQVTDYFNECFIFDGFSPESWHNLIHLNKHTGTFIEGNKNFIKA